MSSHSRVDLQGLAEACMEAPRPPASSRLAAAPGGVHIGPGAIKDLWGALQVAQEKATEDPSI